MNAVLEILRNSILLGGGDSNGHENGAPKDISCFDVEDQVLHDRVEVITDSSDGSDSSHHGIEELKPRKMAVALPLPCIESAGVDSSSNPSKPRKMAVALPLPCIESAGVYITPDPPKPRKMAVALPIPCIESAGVDGRPVPLKPKKMAVALPLPCMESAGVDSPPHPRPKKKTNVKNKTVGKKGYDGTETYQSPYGKSAIEERTEIGELSNRGRTNKASKFKTRELEQQQPAYQQCWHHLVSKTRSTLLGVAVLVIIASIVGATVSKNENGAPSSIDNNEMRSNQPTAEPSSNSSLDKKGYLLSILADYGRIRTDTMSWLIENDTWAPPVSSPNEQQLWVERYAIGSFYFLSNPTKSPWRNQDKWLSSETVCLWYGVQCNTVGEVVEINMPYNDIVGYIPTQIGALTSLAKIQLDSNHFSENIPSEIGALSNLLHIDLYFNQLSASLPDEIGALTSLTGLYLRGNRLTGSLPASIGDLTSLTELQLSENGFSGIIPSQIGKLTNLTTAILNDNKLSGSLPSEIGALKKLKWLELDDNSITGTVPKEIGYLTNLISLVAAKNKLTGKIPTEIGYLKQLFRLDFHNNRLVGRIPRALGGHDQLNTLDLSNNQLSGSVPYLPNSLNKKDYKNGPRCSLASNGFHDTNNGKDRGCDVSYQVTN